jgi:hypothetical protein
MSWQRRLENLGRGAAVVALAAGGVVYCYVVWRAVGWAWAAGLHFYRTDLISAETVRDGIHCFFLAVAVFIFPRFAGLGVPHLRRAGWPLVGFGVLSLVAVAALAAVRVNPELTNPFAGHGPFFFTLGPAAWEVMWPGLIYGFAVAAAGPRLTPFWHHALIAVLTVAAAAYYVPVLVGMRPYDKIAFLAATLAINFLSFHLRRRAASVWPGMAGHLVVKFILTW